jgi:hypothetical protein
MSTEMNRLWAHDITHTEREREREREKGILFHPKKGHPATCHNMNQCRCYAK